MRRHSATSGSNDKDLSPYRILNGRPPQAADEVVIDRSLVKATDYKVGDKAKVNTLEGAKEFTIVGDAVFGTFRRCPRCNRGVSSIRRCRAGACCSKSGQVQTLSGQSEDRDQPNPIGKRAEQTTLKEAKSTNGSAIESITGAALEKENLSFVNQIFTFINIFFNAFAVVALFVSTFVISNSFSIVVAQRTREMAMLRILGAKTQSGSRLDVP